MACLLDYEGSVVYDIMETSQQTTCRTSPLCGCVPLQASVHPLFKRVMSVHSAWLATNGVSVYGD